MQWVCGRVLCQQEILINTSAAGHPAALVLLQGAQQQMRAVSC